MFTLPRRIIRPAALAIGLLTTVSTPVSAQTIEVGPIRYVANGHRYYRLSPSSWSEARAAAQVMGGHLVTINDANENFWVNALVASAGGNTSACLIGLHDTGQEGTFVWESGEPVAYTNWATGQPSNAINENQVVITPGTGLWSDVNGVTVAYQAIVEVPRQEIVVPDEFPTIAAALEFAEEDDHILVRPGTYSTRLTIRKQVHIRSIGGPQATTIDGGQSSTVIRFQPEAMSASIEGFTITGGMGVEGGGIVVNASSPIIRRCVIRGNAASVGGAGVFAVNNSNPRIADCLISENDAPSGAGLLCDNSLVEVINCTIVGNSGAGTTAFFVSGGSLTGRNCIVRGRFAGPRVFTYSNIVGVPGAGNITDDPMLAPDGSLLPGSPCIDAGENLARAGLPLSLLTLDVFSQDRFVNDPEIGDTGVGPSSVVDMGAAEFQGASATCTQDYNGDGSIDPDDLGDFINVYFSGCP